jgi:ADP-heptose:LPS heptosyltransferase
VTPLSFDNKRILVIAYGHLADTMAAVPALRSLRKAHPRAHIDVLALDSTQHVLGPCPYIDRLITWRDFQHKGQKIARAEKLALIAALGLRLRRNRYDATLVFHRSSAAMRRLAKLVGSPMIFGVSHGRDGYTHPVDPSAGAESSREENQRVAAAVGAVDDGGEMELWTAPADAAWAERVLTGGRRPLVGIHPGSDWSCQQWLPERFALAGRELQGWGAAGVVVTGTSGELEMAEQIASALPEAPLNLCGQTSFGQFVEIVRRLDVLICVNSAASAVARAVGTPAVVLLGLEDARYTGVRDGGSLRVIQPGGQGTGAGWCEFGRWGVLSGCNSPMCRGLGGLSRVEPETVVTAALELLAQGEDGARPPSHGTAAHVPGTRSAQSHQVPIGNVTVQP